MSTYSENAKETSRRNFAKLMAAALTALPLAALTGEAAAQTRKRLKKGQVRPDKQGSPITIGGGGSVSIGFNHNTYMGGNGRYSKLSDQIQTAEVYDRYTNLTWDLTSVVRDIDCTITIHTKKRDGSDPKEILIKSKPRGPIIIEFDEAAFPLVENKGHY